MYSPEVERGALCNIHGGVVHTADEVAERSRERGLERQTCLYWRPIHEPTANVTMIIKGNKINTIPTFGSSSEIASITM